VLYFLAMIGIGAYALFRLIVEFLPQTYADLSIYITIWGVGTMFYGGAMALMQDDIKRVFAYSSISQMGYLLFGIGSISTLGLAGAEMMYISHALGKGLLFMSAGILIVQVVHEAYQNLADLEVSYQSLQSVLLLGLLQLWAYHQLVVLWVNGCCSMVF